MKRNTAFGRSLELISALAVAMQSGMAHMIEAARFDAANYKSRGKGGKHSAHSSRPKARRRSKSTYDPRIQGARQAARQQRQGLRMVNVNGFEIMQQSRQ